MKNYSTAVRNALANDNATCFLIEIQSATQTIYLTDSPRDVIYDGHVWVASGLVLGVENRRQQSQIQVQSLSINFTTADQTIVAIFGNANQKGRAVIVTEVIFNAAGSSAVGELTKQRYIINDYSQSDDQFSLDLSNYAARWRMTRGLRTVQSSHQQLYPDSTSFINSKDLKELDWGGE